MPATKCNGKAKFYRMFGWPGRLLRRLRVLLQSQMAEVLKDCAQLRHEL